MSNRNNKHMGYRNGYKLAHLKTAEDRLLDQRPQVADCPETSSSQLWSHIKDRAEQLKRIAVEMYARGCSTRDIPARQRLAGGVERSFLEEKRRSRVIPRFFDEKSGLKSESGSIGLVFATLIRAF